jgi:hypothetical protein
MTQSPGSNTIPVPCTWCACISEKDQIGGPWLLRDLPQIFLNPKGLPATWDLASFATLISRGSTTTKWTRNLFFRCIMGWASLKKPKSFGAKIIGSTLTTSRSYTYQSLHWRSSACWNSSFRIHWWMVMLSCLSYIRSSTLSATIGDSRRNKSPL